MRATEAEKNTKIIYHGKTLAVYSTAENSAAVTLRRALSS